MDKSTFELFQSGNEFKQILFLDNFYESVSLEDETQEEIAKLLSIAINESTNNYVKRSAFIIFLDLTLAKRNTNPFTAVSHLYNFLNCSDYTLQAIALKYLPYFPEVLINGTKELLLELTDSTSGEVASQAFICLGLLQLEVLSNITETDTTSLIKRLSQAKLYFQAAEQSTENRVDSQFYLILITWFESVLAGDSLSSDTNFDELEKSLRLMKLYNFKERGLELELLIFHLTQQVKAIYSKATSSKEWYDVLKEVRVLSCIHLECQKLLNTASNNQAILNRMFTCTFQTIQNSIYKAYLTSEKPRLFALKLNVQDLLLTQFIEHLIAVLPNDTETNTVDTELLSILSEKLGSEKGLMVYQQVITKGIAFEKALAELLKKESSNQLSIRTGSIIGQDILFSLMKQIDYYLPNYLPEKREAFFDVLEEIIRYARATFVGHDKMRFPFLYSEKYGGKGQQALEQDLQDSLYTYLEHSKIADGLDHEKAKFVDGGRVDIMYKKDIITIPIELKKTLNRPDKATLEQNYIAQAQTYTAGYDQLGIFILLELSDKATEPQPNFKDWFKVHHLNPSSNQNIEYPDFIISVVIPGNKTSPSAKSTYK